MKRCIIILVRNTQQTTRKERKKIMKIINKVTEEVIAEITTNRGMTLDEAIELVGEIHSENTEENVEIDGNWYCYDDLELS